MLTKFQVLRCDVALAGDREQVVSRGRGNPVLFPELLVLQHLHGDDAVSEIAVVGELDISNDEMLERLRVTYPEDAVKSVFPGTRPRLPLGDGTIPKCHKPITVARPARMEPTPPRLRPIDALTPTGDTEVVFVDPVVDPPMDASQTPSPKALQAEMADMFGDQFAGDTGDTDTDPVITQETDKQFVQRTVANALAGVTPSPKPDMPDPAAFRARHNVRGEGTSAPRTADHIPDVDGGALAETASTRQLLGAKTRGRG
jgi:hypothetical protein